MPMNNHDNAIARALDLATRAKRADGGSVNDDLVNRLRHVIFPQKSYADGGSIVSEMADATDPLGHKIVNSRKQSLPPEDISDVVAQAYDPLRRRMVSRRTPEEVAADPSSRAFGRLAGTVAAELTGVPSIIRGGEDIKRGWDEGDGVRALGGAGQAALGLVPGAGLTRAGSAAIRPFFSTASRAVATSLGANLPSAFSNEAEARNLNSAKAVASDPEVSRLNREIERLQALRTERSTQPIPGIKNVQSADAARTRAGEQIQKDIDILVQKRSELERSIVENYAANAPFRERYPGAAPALLLGGLGFAAGLPGAKEAAKGLSDRFSRAPRMEDAANKFEGLLGRNATGEAARSQDVLRREISAWDKHHGAIPSTADAVGNAAKGALIGAEMSALPEQTDYVSFAPGHPTRDAAENSFKDPSYYVGRLAPAMLGATAGITGQTVGKAISGYDNPHLSRARMLADIGGYGQPSDRIREALGLADRSANAVNRLRNYENATSVNSLSQKDALAQQSRAVPLRDQQRQLQAQADELKAVEGTGPKAVPADVPAFRPMTIGPAEQTVVQKMEQQRELSPLLRNEVGSNLASDAPRPLVIRQSNAGYHYAADHPDGKGGQFVPHEIVKGKPSTDGKPKVVNKKASKDADVEPSRDAALSSGSSAVKKGYIIDKPARDFDPSDPINRGSKNGGAISKGLDIARKYATGGRVHVGPVVGSTGGRSDKLPVDVASGSFVLPADTVSGIPGAEGNTLAGMKILEKMFGKPGMANGGTAVPIKISDGEFVLTPSQVMKIGGGDIDAGHRALDAFVKKVRADHVATLQKLPPPAQ